MGFIPEIMHRESSKRIDSGAFELLQLFPDKARHESCSSRHESCSSRHESCSSGHESCSSGHEATEALEFRDRSAAG
jgi:hypothetical protein